MKHVIILAHGDQKRVRTPIVPGIPVFARTLAQIRALDNFANVTLVAPHTLAPAAMWPTKARMGRYVENLLDVALLELETHELADPGNSALKGVSRYLDHRRDLQNLGAFDFEVSQTIVLLGDCIYSWRCMEVLLADETAYNFVGSSNLTDDAGKLWGVTWHDDADTEVIGWLKKALRKHPTGAPQRRQLRQWMFAARQELEDELVTFTGVDDYTSDVEGGLAALSRALHEDSERGVEWS